MISSKRTDNELKCKISHAYAFQLQMLNIWWQPHSSNHRV